jgi:hypothetical protein
MRTDANSSNVVIVVEDLPRKVTYPKFVPCNCFSYFLFKKKNYHSTS